MDVYGLSTPDYFRIDDLLDFSNDDLFSSTAAASANIDSSDFHHLPTPENPSVHHRTSALSNPTLSSGFTGELCVPSDDVAELEWLSRFVDDSFNDFPANSLTGTLATNSSFSVRARSKRSRANATAINGATRMSSLESQSPTTGKSKSKKEIQRSSSPTADGGVRRCTHCASEKTPQWRTGPLGPKTLCNACGVRYKSGRLVPEYRPAASPTFVLTQHSNSHRKVLELRRQKEMLRQQQQQERQMYHNHRQHNFEVC